MSHLERIRRRVVLPDARDRLIPHLPGMDGNHRQEERGVQTAHALPPALRRRERQNSRRQRPAPESEWAAWSRQQIALGAVNEEVARRLPLRPGDRPNLQDNEYNVRMTHARARPRAGFTYDFDQSQDQEASSVQSQAAITCASSPSAKPAGWKGKGRLVERKIQQQGRQCDQTEYGPSASTSKSLPAAISSKFSSEAISPKVYRVLVCGSCRRPLRTGCADLWALRCGHMIDSHCYHKFGELPVTQDIGAPPAQLPEGDVEWILEWDCPVSGCERTHWTELVVKDGQWVWRPVEGTGAIQVYA
ncbi:hypothetical protein FRC09_008142 [Ceratobasidium sp. 395]|nr:hypothetical protein FRC09_008142 [Ceratobasidium sp. 395]